MRLEVSAGCSQFLLDFLQRQFALPKAALYRVHGPVTLVRLTQLVDLVADPALLFPIPRAPQRERIGITGQPRFLAPTCGRPSS